MKPIIVSAKYTSEYRRRAELVGRIALDLRESARKILGAWEFKKVDLEATKNHRRLADYLYEWADEPLTWTGKAKK